MPAVFPLHCFKDDAECLRLFRSRRKRCGRDHGCPLERIAVVNDLLPCDEPRFDQSVESAFARARLEQKNILRQFVFQHQILEQGGTRLRPASVPFDELRRLCRVIQPAVRTGFMFDLSVADRSGKETADRQFARTAVIERHPLRKFEQRIGDVRRVGAERINRTQIGEVGMIRDLHDIAAPHRRAFAERNVDFASGFDRPDQMIGDTVVEKTVEREIQCNPGDGSVHDQSSASCCRTVLWSVPFEATIPRRG